jgi:hypothetical protein
LRPISILIARHFYRYYRHITLDVPERPFRRRRILIPLMPGDDTPDDEIYIDELTLIFD